MDYKIKDIKARQVFDSRGNPTVEVDVFSNSLFSRASIPSGASTGKYEAIEIRDGGDMLMGKGVQKVINNIEKRLRDQLIGFDIFGECLLRV